MLHEHMTNLKQNHLATTKILEYIEEEEGDTFLRY